MKTTFCIWGLVAAAILASPAPSAQGSSLYSAGVLIAQAAVGQADSGSKRPSKLFAPLLSRKPKKEQAPATDPFEVGRNTESLLVPDAKNAAQQDLAQGREFLQQNNLPAAAHWCRKAAEHQAIFGPDEDAPEKLWADITAAGGNAASTDPANGLLAQAPESAGGRYAGRQDAGVEQNPFGRSTGASPEESSSGSQVGSLIAGRNGQAAPDAQRQSSGLLIEARRALAVGDVKRCRGLLDQAGSMDVRYGPFDDSPAKLEATLRKHAAVAELRAAEGDTEQTRRRTAEMLLEQAEGLLRWREFDDAERLARDAAQLPVNYGHFDSKPSDVIARIEAARRGDAPQGNPKAGPATGGQTAAEGDGKQQVAQLVRQARAAQAAGDLFQAERLAKQAQELRVPDSAFAPREDRPAFVLLELQEVRLKGSRAPGGAMQAGHESPADGNATAPSGNRAIYNAEPGQVERVQPAGLTAGLGNPSQGSSLRRLPPAEAAGQDAAGFAGRLPAGASPASPLDEAAAEQTLLEKKISVEVADREVAARKILEKEPKQAIALLQEARTVVENANLSADGNARLMRRLERSVSEAEKYIRDNRARIELDERNRSVLDEIDRERVVKVEVQNKLALLVDDYNKLMDEQRWAEAEVIAKQAGELAPDEPVVLQINKQSKLIRNYHLQMDIKDEKEDGVLRTLASVDNSSIPFDDSEPYVFPDAKTWDALTKKRGDLPKRRSEKEIEIEKRLKTPVSLQFKDAPLSQVTDYLAKLAQVNLHLDSQGLAEEGVTPDTAVTIDLSQDISLKSALNLILEPLHLSYVITDEVLKITSEQLKNGELVVEVYNVADLVIGIPNFAPNNRMGLQGALADAHANLNFGGPGGFGGGQGPVAVVASKDGNPTNAMISPTALGNVPGLSGSAATSNSANQPTGSGPGGLGGAVQPDFDSLIELITTTVSPQTWDEVGGPGSIAESATNLSLVISQTQEVHDEIVDLLNQLRRLQDLQVTIEVRFITLNDDFFERIGVDFDFDIDDDIDKPFQTFGRFDPNDSTDYQGSPFNANTGVNRDVQDRDHGQSSVVGMSLPGVFSADLDIPFRQDSFTLSRPTFGGFDPAAGASAGFAILSDVEAYFFIEAAQGDRRTNVLQAPKVTLFNGQQAVVSDTSQSPFVISVIPVVGDFAAAQQPVIVVLSEGTFLTVQAIVSSDRRFVRLTVVPFFSQIGDVNTFTFTGSESTSRSSSSEGPDDETTGRDDEVTTTRSGTTVQLPTFSFVTVTTTVSVPDGGTVLLGGIKRLREGRNEFGVPILNKLPYVNRLFKNVGVGRETSSLMMMVTPRIIIQEEEEALLGISSAP